MSQVNPTYAQWYPLTFLVYEKALDGILKEATLTRRLISVDLKDSMHKQTPSYPSKPMLNRNSPEVHTSALCPLRRVSGFGKASFGFEVELCTVTDGTGVEAFVATNKHVRI